MTERVWDRFLTEQDKAHLAASAPIRSRGFGKTPAVLSVDNYRKALGDRPEHLLDAIQTWPSSTGLAGWAAADKIAELLLVARGARIPVIHVTGLAEEESGISPWGAALGGRHGRATRSDEEVDRYRRRFDFIDQAAPIPGEVVLKKTGPSGFFGTPLLAHLIARHIDTLIVCGESVSGCVRATVTDGCANRLHVVVVEECVYDRHEATRAMNLFDIDQKYGDVVSFEEAVAWMAAYKQTPVASEQTRMTHDFTAEPIRPHAPRSIL
jgi:nicotinamidase-related amidase